MQTQRSQKKSFGAARNTMPFDRVGGDKYMGGNRLFCIECKSTCEFEIYPPSICEQVAALSPYGEYKLG
jgi:hypothetical protein